MTIPPFARLAIAVLAILLALDRAASTQTLPPGFEDAVVVGVPSPTALAFTPDLRMLVTSQPGQLFVVEGDNLIATPALDLSPSMCTETERGLLGVAVDPQFATNGFIYVFYTFKKGTGCPRNVPGTPVNRVSRFTMSGNTVNRASEVVLIDNIPSFNANHNSGDLHFGRDGYLYISTGDGGCDYSRATGCAGDNGASRYLHALVGKVLRITSTGGIPSTNPFRGSDSVRCNVIGVAQPGQKCQETFAWGFRNPWRLAFDPNAATTRFFINDVGQNTWEEVNEAVAGADYGWNVREGKCARGSVTDCGPQPIGMTNPIYAYRHDGSGCQAITGGAFVPSGVWPVEFEGTYLFADYTCGSIFKLARAANGTYSRSTFVSGLGASSAVSLVFGPSGSSQALYYLTYANGGEVRRITAVSGTNRTPIASAAASPRFGPLPLAVHFDASASSDPDDDSLTFDWNFNDGSAHAITAVVNHTYTVAGRFVATVTVNDGHGHTSAASITIEAGNTPPTPSITSPSSTAKFAVGDVITLRGTASDPQDGTIPDARLTWEVLLHHGNHTHPWLQPRAGNAIAIEAPAPEDLAATKTSYLEIRLTATDSQGASSTVRRDMQPRLVDVTFATTPPALVISVNGTTISTPQTVTSWDRYALTVTASTQRDASGQPFLFASWSDGGAATHTVATPPAAATYTASFVRARVTAPSADAYARAGAYATRNFGTALTLDAKRGASADTTRQPYLRFALPTAPVGRALLRLHGGLSSSTNDVALAIYSVADTSWAETNLTWNNRPTLATASLATTVVKGTASAWYEWDVTAYVRAQLAAGRTAVSFSLTGTNITTSYASFASREALADRPELITSDAAAPSSPEIVLYAAEASRLAGAWRLINDTTAAAGVRINHPDANAPKLTTPLAAPINYFELTFTAQAGRAYRLWIRGKADRDSYNNDSVFVQFSSSVTSAGAATFRIGTTSATSYVLEDCGGCHEQGWGWQDNGYGTGVLGPLIYFASSGTETMRIQTREDGLSIDQVILSSNSFLTSAPGLTKNDQTIVPKP